MKSDLVLSELQIKSLINHPRLVELYIILHYDMFFNQLGDDATLSFFKMLCTANTIDYERVRLLLTRYSVVKNGLRTNETQFYNEVALLATVYGKSRYWAAQKWLGLSKATFYAKTYGATSESLTSVPFSETMDREVVLAGSKDIYRELVRFRDALRLLEGVYL